PPIWSLLFCISSTSILSRSMAARTAFQRRSSSSVEIGVCRRSDNCSISLSLLRPWPRSGLISVRHYVDHAAGIAGEEAAHVGFHGRPGVIDIDVTEAALMGGDDHVVHRPERMIGRQRLLGEHIER